MIETPLSFNMWMDILQYIGEQRADGEELHIGGISQSLRATYSHTHNIIKTLEEKKLISTNKQGRKHLVDITKSGRHAADNIKELRETLEGKQ